MKFNSLDARMRELEYFHGIRLPLGMWAVIRVDGRSFSRFTAQAEFNKPFDERFSGYMRETAAALLDGLHGIYAYTESDEISVLFKRSWDIFDRELEKLISISASMAASKFTQLTGFFVQFDSRVWISASEEDVIDYFRWRQTDATRCAINGICYWTLRKEGKAVKETTELLDSLNFAAKNELLFQRGINFNEFPAWQKRGVGLYWEDYEKEGFNPVTQQPVKALRKRVKVDLELPLGDAYGQFIAEICRKADQ